MTIEIRDGTVDDAAGLEPVYAELGYPTSPAVLRERIASMLANDRTARMLVATRDGRIVGVACLHVTPMVHRPTSVGRITALGVLESEHGSGAGRRLVEACEAHFRVLGLTRIEVTSGPKHAPAHSFYRHLAFADDGVRFVKTL